MASRDNQGLQIAVILLVMLVVGLGITTGVFYNANLKSLAEAKAANKKASGESQLKTQYLGERNRLKELIGHSVDATMDEVNAQFTRDVASFIADEAGKTPDLQQINYRKIPIELRNKYGTLEQDLATARERENTLVAERDTLRKQTQSEIAEARATADKYAGELRALQNQSQQMRDSLQKQQQTVLAQKQAIEGQVFQVTTTKDKVISDRDKEIDRQKGLLLAFEVKKAGEEIQITDVPDGKIVWTNQRERIVWIDLGSADGLRPQMTFSVYEKGVYNLAESKRKGTIEITRIHDRHQAEAQIQEFDITNPIMPGDVFFTPTWDPGHPLEFAMVGVMDVDGDDKDDSSEIRRIIETAGGKVVAYVDDNGTTKGSMTPDARFLILGERPTDSSTESALSSYAELREAARENGVETIRYDRFIDWAGYIGTEELVRLRNISKLDELEAQAEKAETGFAPRRPKSGNSAF